MTQLIHNNPCPKCSQPMVRKYRNKKHDRKKKAYGYTEWDYCLSCRHIQHYEKYKFKTGFEKRTQLPKKNLKLTYREYLKSKHWTLRKRRYFQDFGKRCEVCGKSSGVTLHHKVYKKGTYGREPNSDIVALCGKHHKIPSFS